MLPSPSLACQQRGKGLEGGLLLRQTIPRAKNKEKMSRGVTPHLSIPPVSRQPCPELAPCSQDCCLLSKRKKKGRQGLECYPDFLPPALFLFLPLKKEFYPLTLPCPGLARKPQHLGASRQPTAAGRARGGGPARPDKPLAKPGIAARSPHGSVAARGTRSPCL